MYTSPLMSVHWECLRSSLVIAVKTVNTGLGFNSSLTSGTLLCSWGCGFSYKERKIKLQKLKEDINRTLLSVSGKLRHVNNCFLLSEVACVPVGTATNAFSLQFLLHTHGSTSISYSCDPLEMIWIVAPSPKEVTNFVFSWGFIGIMFFSEARKG